MPGACCSGDSCRVEPDQHSCEVIFFGTFFDGFACDEVDCTIPAVLGACCLPSGGCDFIPRTSIGSPVLGCIDRCECCFPDGTCQPLDENCAQLGGEIVCGEFLGPGVRCEVPDSDPPRTICDPPPPPEGCIQARPDRGTGRPGWSANLCQNVMIEPEEPGDDGDWGTASPHKVRALPGDHLTEDPCAYHRASLIIDGDGFAQAALCSRPNRGDEGSLQWSLADVFVAEQDPNALLEPGEAAWMGAYAAPLFTEVHLRSHKRKCNADV